VFKKLPWTWYRIRYIPVVISIRLILNEDERRVLTKFRVSAHNVEIEKGRYIGVKTEDRICKLCNTGVEDETHFLLHCPVLENKRTQIINNIKNVNIDFNNLPNKSKLIWLMSSEDKFIIKNTSSLLCSLFKWKVKIDWKMKNKNNNIQ
jgi:hypothetical protein